MRSSLGRGRTVGAAAAVRQEFGEQGVQIRIDALQFGMPVMPLDDLAIRMMEGHGRREVGYETADLGVVEHDGVSHVTAQLPRPLWSEPLVTSQFSNVYVGSPNTVPGSGSSAQRGAGVPLNGVFRAKQVCQGGNCWNEPRRVFSLWFPPNGTWVTKWDIFAGGSPTSCQWGVDIDMPIAHIDRDGDMATEMAIYRADKHSGANSNAWLSIRNSSGGASCNGTQTNYALWSLNRPRNMVFAVSDMTGDGKAEILIVNPDTMTVNWLTSQSDYTIWESRTIGNQRAVVL